MSLISGENILISDGIGITHHLIIATIGNYYSISYFSSLIYDLGEFYFNSFYIVLFLISCYKFKNGLLNLNLFRILKLEGFSLNYPF